MFCKNSRINFEERGRTVKTVFVKMGLTHIKVEEREILVL